MVGRLHAVVGPSGAGKDTLIDAARAVRRDLAVARRVITRPTSAGGEDFEGVSVEEFDRRLEAGEFALHWEAHGLKYGVPIEIEIALNEGRDVVFNGSRAILPEAYALYPNMGVLLITASPEVLAERLAARGRESRAEIEKRLARAEYDIAPGLPVRRVNNDGALDEAVAAFLAALQPERV
ncbi:MAG: phosphonate metabolism protein/1,5-bisphosphokinase (PRPP-forming) PhnN [Alphaproteobacteria bacterium]|jgi:ribose 1,5-bisphosphokinase|nr:phosphonate metabolism protein/1,5-bisphosphokinase (PRPP-forming) PhnN [Alphaproteobacteria bacterium]MBU1278370.1 phosphonate metabolism protein/1,5-bisphosphokinase (PRPP-forming) PhnN [Alphaproteobacteria bacterium]MBU1575407.1 phosphonate metabolism protein/1,5-bisphosphokinase (PRPP-forming) PhnN [Alphaproteobacteria bacterium]MBU1828740.1 phosphonate metabolism protein/1,5-bisphosphokinase (PRPP-forming) PhnN [Alphaproteobacteria bacterium]MBU2077970.1 phosphonate metabolism protein/1